MLKQCPECRVRISTQALQCPHCGFTTGYLRVEETAKSLKLHWLLAKTALWLGLFAAASLLYNAVVPQDAVFGYHDYRAVRLSLALYLIPISFLWLCVTRFRIWWNHG